LWVSEFIDRTAGQWDMEKLNMHFLPMDVQIICNIPISTRKQANFWAWHYDKKGTFSVRSAYRMLSCIKDRREAWLEGNATSSNQKGLQKNWTNLWHI
jgi:hypothetical protein